MNHHLQERNLFITDFTTDLQDGLILINLLEIISGKRFPRYVKNPKFAAQKLANITEALNFMESEYDLKFIGLNAQGTVFIN